MQNSSILQLPQCHLQSIYSMRYRAAPPAPLARRRGQRRRERQLLLRGLLRDPPQGRPHLLLVVWKTLDLQTSVQRRRWRLVLRQASLLLLARPSAQPWQQVRRDWSQ